MKCPKCGKKMEYRKEEDVYYCAKCLYFANTEPEATSPIQGVAVEPEPEPEKLKEQEPKEPTQEPERISLLNVTAKIIGAIIGKFFARRS